MDAVCPSPELTIVIPAKNEITYLPRLLNCLARQDYPAMRSVPVIVADAGSTDGTAEAALAFADSLQVKVIPGGLPSVGRNAGARAAATPYLLFLDADIELDDTTLIRRALRLLRRRRLHCLTTSIRCISRNPFDHALYFANNLMQRIGSFTKPFGTGMFLLFETAAFQRLGGFDESALFAEDYHLTRQISPRRFGILRGHILTSNRRFLRTGRFRMVFLFFRTMLNTWNDSYFENDHRYWENPSEAEQQ
ncbi:glycosyltransferase [Terriglobus tenax]|uniref:glycosyltransferase n=1 Tax=Terriglobus tenax TaxID=1111115 RepID=UPI0021DFC036|nr:glycosyltransferase [Terriglobus tenax]